MFSKNFNSRAIFSLFFRTRRITFFGTPLNENCTKFIQYGNIRLKTLPSIVNVCILGGRSQTADDVLAILNRFQNCPSLLLLQLQFYFSFRLQAVLFFILPSAHHFTQQKKIKFHSRTSRNNQILCHRTVYNMTIVLKKMRTSAIKDQTVFAIVFVLF